MTLLPKRTLVGAVGSALASPQGGNARMRTPLLLFPKISQCFRTLRFSGTLFSHTYDSIRKE